MSSPDIRALASGNHDEARTYHRFCQLFVVVDDRAHLVAVAVWRVRQRRFTVSRVTDKVRFRVRATWRGPAPRVGHYLQARLARYAYRITTPPRPSVTGAILMDVMRVSLPVPPGAVVHSWRWVPGKRRGTLVQGGDR
jgi:hypothetical protein